MKTRRTEALSDSTFAVAMTLLIFDVRVPVGGYHARGVAHDLWFSEWYHYLGYLVSFVVIGMIWMNHHSIFRLLRRIDHTGMVLNLGLLGVVVFLPFPTQLLAIYLVSHPNLGDVVAVFYGLSLAAATLMMAVLWHHLARRPELLHPDVEPAALGQLTRRLYLTPVLYVVATGIAAIDHWAGVGLYLAIACVYVLHTGTRAFPTLDTGDEDGPVAPGALLERKGD